jgi:hypothetical protein
MVYLYHYTDKNGALGIAKSKRINSSKNTTTDAVYGKGVYLTSMSPTAGKKNILKNNYDDAIDSTKIELTKVKYYFRFDSTELSGVKKISDTKRDVWLYSKDIDLKSVSYEFGTIDEPQDIMTYYDGENQATSIALT